MLPPPFTSQLLDRLYVKLFHRDADLAVQLFIDASSSMLFPSRSEKFLPACHVVLANNESVRFHILQETGDGLASRAPRHHGRAGFRQRVHA